MTTCFVQASGTIELLLYDELDTVERAEAQQHLLACTECRQALDELKVIRSSLDLRPDVSAPSGGDWAPFMARLDDAVGREGSIAGAPPEKAAGRRIRHHAGLIAMAALLTLVTTSVAYLARYRAIMNAERSAIEATIDADGAQPRPWSEDAAFAALSEQHFTRAKLVVLGLMNRDPNQEGKREWAYERELASTLLSDTRLYRLAAEERGMTALARIMADLELVLLQTSMSPRADPETLQEIQSLIRKRDLVTKMAMGL